MRPHMAHINNTLIKKKLAEDAKDQVSSYQRYRTIVKTAREAGYTDHEIMSALCAEKTRIQQDEREGDEIFKEGVRNSKIACLNAISMVMSEIED